MWMVLRQVAKSVVVKQLALLVLGLVVQHLSSDE